MSIITLIKSNDAVLALELIIVRLAMLKPKRTLSINWE